MRNLSLLLLVAANAVFAAGPDTCSVPWSYNRTALNGPARWGTLDERYDTCLLGEEQTPVDISGALYDGPTPGVIIRPGTKKIIVEKLPYTLEVMPAEAGASLGTMTIDGAEYDILQFHFHGPSEHLLRGVSYPLEMHWVTRRISAPSPGSQIQADLAVFGIMLTPGTTNAGLAPVLALIPSAAVDPLQACPSRPSNEAINLRSILEGFQARYLFGYGGSLTTPPCTQGVRWLVAANPMEVSSAQIAAIVAALPRGGNARPRQPLADRKITAGGTLSVQ